MALPLTAVLTYSALAGGGLSAAQLAARMAAVVLYSAPPPNASQLPAGTSDAVFDCLFGANVISDVTSDAAAPIVTRTVTLGLRPAAGAPTAPSFVSLGNASGSATAPTNNPPLPSPLYPFATVGAGVKSAWTGSIVSSSPGDFFGTPASGPGARTLTISYLDVTGAPLTEVVPLNGRTPVNLANPDKYIITDVEITTAGPTGAAPLGQVNIWSGPVDPVTGLQTGIQVGYLPNSFFAHFSFQLLAGWTLAQVADPRQANQLVPPDYGYPDATVITPPPGPPPPPSKYLLDYPPPSSVANPNAPDSFGGVAVPITDVVGGKAVRVSPLTPAVSAPVNDPLLTPAADFTTSREYLSRVFYGALGFVPSPFQGLGLGAFARALNMPLSRVPLAGTVSMGVAFV